MAGQRFSGSLRPSWSAFRKAGVLLLLLAVVPLSCKKAKPGPKEIYERWAEAVSQGRCKALYPLLDEKSRWAVMSAAKDTAKAAAVIQRSYPENRRRQELSKLGVRVADGDPATYFEAICQRYRYPALLANTAGKIAKLNVSGNKAVVTTDKGVDVELSKDQYGRWGCKALATEVHRRQVMAANFLKMVQTNAETFRKARAVGGPRGGN